MIKSKILRTCIKCLPGFVVGVIVGGVAAAYFVKKKLQKKFDEQTKLIRKSYKKVYDLKYQEKIDELNKTADALIESGEAEEIIEDDGYDIPEYVEELHEEKPKKERVAYSKISSKDKKKDETKKLHEDKPKEYVAPYEILDDMHYECGEGYTLEELTYNVATGYLYYDKDGHVLDPCIEIPQKIGQDNYDKLVEKCYAEMWIRNEGSMIDYCITSIQGEDLR